MKKYYKRKNEPSDFDNFRFEGLNASTYSNKYLTMKRYSENLEKIVVKVGDNHLMRTKYGFALILDHSHVVFLKSWQVNQNFYGNEVILSKEYFIIKEWGTHEEFSEEDPKEYSWEKWVEVAIEQENADNKVMWNKETEFSNFMYGF